MDKSALPKAMQVRRDKFGKLGQTKYTHLADQDTTDKCVEVGQVVGGWALGKEWALEREKDKREERYEGRLGKKEDEGRKIKREDKSREETTCTSGEM